MFQFSTCQFFNQPANPTLIITQTCMFFYASQKSVKKGSFSSGALQFSCPRSIRLPSDQPSWQRHTWGILLQGSAGQRLLHTVASHLPLQSTRTQNGISTTYYTIHYFSTCRVSIHGHCPVQPCWNGFSGALNCFTLSCSTVFMDVLLNQTLSLLQPIIQGNSLLSVMGH